VLKADVEGYDFQELSKIDEIASLMVKMCCGFKFCVISRLYFFGVSYYVIVLLSSFYIIISEISSDYKFCAPSSRHTCITIIVFHVCHFGICIKLDNVDLKFFTLSTFFLQIHANFQHFDF
jgi:hypothetical protein